MLTADIALGDPQRMVAWISGAPAHIWRLQASEYLLFAQAFGFAALTITMIWRYRRQASSSLANFNPAIFRWLLLLQVFTIVIWILNALPALSPAPPALAQLANLLMVLLIYVIAVTQWRTPELFRIPSLGAEQAAGAREHKARAASTQDGELDPELRARLYESIREAVEEQQLFRDSQLTLSSLAESTGISRHQVSEVLNRHAGRNFYEFVNEYRIAAVCERLAGDPGETILNIALDSGFSSKSTFNAIFKQFTGLTPTAYRKKNAFLKP